MLRPPNSEQNQPRISLTKNQWLEWLRKVESLNTVEIQTCFPEFIEFSHKYRATLSFYQHKVKKYFKIGLLISNFVKEMMEDGRWKMEDGNFEISKSQRIQLLQKLVFNEKTK